jgi:hypothetical protein
MARLREGCHLLDGTPDQAQWTSELCASCPTPEITQANRCETMVLHGEVSRPGWRFWARPRMIVTAFCTRSGEPVADPMVGCGLCHPHLEFVVKSGRDAPNL